MIYFIHMLYMENGTPKVSPEMMEEIYVSVVIDLYHKKYHKDPSPEDVVRVVAIAKEYGWLDQCWML